VTSARHRAVHLTADRFDDAIADHRVALVDFWAGWCAPCRTMAPDLDQVAREAPDDVLVAKVDVDAEQALAERFAIRSMPTIITFHQGELHTRYVGAVPAAGLRAALQEADSPRRRGLLRRMFSR